MDFRHLTSLTLVCPACNESGNIEPLLREWHATFENLGTPFEMIVVDDGSTDGTASEVRRMMEEFGSIRLLRHTARCGQSAALATGIERANGDVIVTCDADLQNDPADLPRMLELLPEADVVCGWRHRRKDTWKRRLVSGGANRIMQRLFGHQLHDSGCGLRIFRRSVAERLLMIDGMHRFFALLALIEGFSIAEVPVNHRDRVQGVSKYGLFDRLFRTLRDLNGLLWYRSRRLERGFSKVVEEEMARDAVASAPVRNADVWPASIPFRPTDESGNAVRRKSA